jgi:hypothetical protein
MLSYIISNLPLYYGNYYSFTSFFLVYGAFVLARDLLDLLQRVGRRILAATVRISLKSLLSAYQR